jgi:hypothetical protein
VGVLVQQGRAGLAEEDEETKMKTTMPVYPES